MRLGSARALLIWAALVIALVVPIAFAATSPFLAYREPIYIVAGLAGVVSLALVLVQPLLAGGYLPGLSALRGRRAHGLAGALLVAVVVVHVAGLWITSPPDVVDALLFTSPASFSPWGVIAMWALFVAATLVALRRRLRIPSRTWRISHTILAAVIVIGGVVHALLIEGTMETVSKAALCVLVVAATVVVAADLWMRARRAKSYRGIATAADTRRAAAPRSPPSAP